MVRSRKGSEDRQSTVRMDIKTPQGRGAAILWPTILPALSIIPALIFRADRRIALVFGEYLMLWAVTYWCIGWFLWLAQDGLSFLSTKLRSTARTKADQWREEVRMPGMDIQPDATTTLDPDPQATPGDRFLQEMPSTSESGGASRETEGDGSDGKARRREANRAQAKRLAVAGVLVFALGALFQYVLAMIPWMP